jgi:hypothetical protein
VMCFHQMENSMIIKNPGDNIENSAITKNMGANEAQESE